MTEPFDAQHPSRLDMLPTEIIQRIASKGSFESTISLLQVNRALYKACNNWTVFQGIIENNLHHFGPGSQWDLTSVAHRDPSIWSRYAYADSKAVQFMYSKDKFAAYQLNQWLPHLIALQRTYSHCFPNTERISLGSLYTKQDPLGLHDE